MDELCVYVKHYDPTILQCGFSPILNKKYRFAFLTRLIGKSRTCPIFPKLFTDNFTHSNSLNFQTLQLRKMWIPTLWQRRMCWLQISSLKMSNEFRTAKAIFHLKLYNPTIRLLPVFWVTFHDHHHTFKKLHNPMGYKYVFIRIFHCFSWSTP